jgi:hypothetical protein
MTDTFDKIKGTLVYVQVDKPGKGYKDPASGTQNPDEWKVGIVLTDEDYVDALKEHAKKNKWQMSDIKDIKVSEFEAKYKCPVPEEAKSQKKVWLMTVKKSTMLGRTGNEVPEIYRPKVYQKIKNTLVDITHDPDKIPANGSEGYVSLNFFEKTTGFTSVSLKNVLVTNLIPYVKSSSEVYSPGAEFDDADIPASAFKDKEPAKAVAKAKVSKAETSELESDIPFN